MFCFQNILKNPIISQIYFFLWRHILVLYYGRLVLLWDEVVEGFRLTLLFVTIFQKYTSTLQIVWTRTCYFYHESKMGMTSQRLECTLKGSGCRRCTRFSVVFSYVSMIYIVPSFCITCYWNFLRQVKAWVERLKRPPTENAKILFNDTEGSK